MKVVKQDTRYEAAPYGYVATIPKGTPVVEARNLPKVNGESQWWVTNWDGIENDPKAESWGRTYGFLLSPEEVEDEITEG